MVYDCFCFFNELDVLDIRLHTLGDVVDRFVIVESTYTHQRRPKPLYFQKYAERYAKFKDKIIHIVLTDCPSSPEGCPQNIARWQLENLQRNAAVQGLVDAEDSDVMMVSDCDEIPNPELLRKWINKVRHGEIVRFYERMYYAYLNLWDLSEFMWTQGTQLCTVGTFRDPNTYRKFPFGEPVSREFNHGGTLTQIRFCKPHHCVYDAGWHFSYIGDKTKIIKKIESIAEGVPSELVARMDVSVEVALKNGTDILSRGHCLARDSYSRLPAYVRSNQQLFRDNIRVGNAFEATYHKVAVYYLKWALRQFWRTKIGPVLWYVKHRILLNEKEID